MQDTITKFINNGKRVSFYLGNMLITCRLDINFFHPGGDYSFPYHCHKDFELHYIVDGVSREYVDGVHLDFHPGHCLLVPPYVYHEHRPQPGEQILRHSFRFTVENKVRNMTDINKQEVQTLNKFLATQSWMLWKDESGLIEEMDRLKGEVTNGDIGSESMAKSIATKIMLMIIRQIGHREEREASPPSDIVDVQDIRIFVTDRFFGKCYMKKVTAKDLADELGVSERHLNRLMLLEFGMTFRQKLIDVRMKMAMRLLKSTEETVEQIADKVGYEEASNFSSMFKAKTKMTPTQYRQLARNDQDNIGEL